MDEILLSVDVITYNQKDFIRKCLDSILMQKTNFAFEVLIHDDASTDGTADIIREYEAKYPHIIKPIYQTENQFSKGVGVSKKFNFPRVKGKYLAICEGDDYWTDEYKLQRQVDFLESHPDFAVCFHPVKVVWEDHSQPDSIFPTPKYRFNKTVLELSDLLKRNFIQTNSVVYRWMGNETEAPSGILPGDWFLHLMHAQCGKIGFLPEVMGVYRKNQGGIWTGYGKTDEWFLRCAIPHMRFFLELKKWFGVDKTQNVVFLGQHMVSLLLKRKKFDTLLQMSQEFPDWWEKLIPEPLDKETYRKEKRLKRQYCFFKWAFFLLLLVIVWGCFYLMS